MILRVIGATLLAVAVVLVAADVVTWTQTGRFMLSALGSWWFWLDKDSLQVLQPAVERHLSPALWDPGVQTLLEWPAAVQVAVIGSVIFGLGSWLRNRA
ncbi:MAG: hypothetical protein AAF334_01415 [Pseudomonadota bacterium]